MDPLQGIHKEVWLAERRLEEKAPMWYKPAGWEQSLLQGRQEALSGNVATGPRAASLLLPGDR